MRLVGRAVVSQGGWLRQAHAPFPEAAPCPPPSPQPHPHPDIPFSLLPEGFFPSAKLA